MPVFFYQLLCLWALGSFPLVQSTIACAGYFCWRRLPKKSGRGWPHHRFKMFWNHNCTLVKAQGGQWLLSCTHTRSKGCLQLSCLEPHPPHLLHHPSSKTMFHNFSHLAATPQPLWKQQDLHRRNSTRAEVAPLLHPLVSEEMEVSINDKEWLVQTTCRKASFTLYLAAAHPCAIQQAKCYLLLFFI